MLNDAALVYARRDAQGRIVAVSLEPVEGMEVMGSGSEELEPFVQALREGQVAFESSDKRLIRVLEDVVDLMISRDLIRFTDLPQAAQDKLLARKSLRRELDALNLLGDPGDTI